MSKVQLLLPIAGASSRFPNMKPKWMLTHPYGNIMLVQSCMGLDMSNISTIYVTLLKEHDTQYDASEGIKKAFAEIGLDNKLRICVLDQPTRSQPETVAETIQKCNIQGPIFIKDSDNYFEQSITAENTVSTYNLENAGMVYAANKSYVSVRPFSSQQLIDNIVEKKIISPYFCCGGYGFESAEQYLTYYAEIASQDNLYISHVIYHMLLNDITFFARNTEEYIDWGTIEDWNRYTSEFATLFVDLDGVLVENSGQFFGPRWGTTEAIEENVEKVNKLYNSGKCIIIITTSRPYSYKDLTVKQLDRLGIKYHNLICELPHAKRYLINDFASSNPYPSSVAINIPRNSVMNDILPR